MLHRLSPWSSRIDEAIELGELEKYEQEIDEEDEYFHCLLGELDQNIREERIIIDSLVFVMDRQVGWIVGLGKNNLGFPFKV